MNRVLKTLVASVATVSLVGAPAIAMVEAGPAGATTAVTAPAGKYKAFITYGTTTIHTPLSLTAAGKFTFEKELHGKWTETADVVHMTGKIGKDQPMHS